MGTILEIDGMYFNADLIASYKYEGNATVIITRADRFIFGGNYVPHINRILKSRGTSIIKVEREKNNE